MAQIVELDWLESLSNNFLLYCFFYYKNVVNRALF